MPGPADELFEKLMGTKPKKEEMTADELFERLMRGPTAEPKITEESDLYSTIQKSMGQKPVVNVAAEAISKIPQAAAGKELARKYKIKEQSAENFARQESMLKTIASPVTPESVKQKAISEIEQYPAALQMGPGIGLEIAAREGGKIPVITSRKSIVKVPGGLPGFPQELKTKEGIPIALYSQISGKEVTPEEWLQETATEGEDWIDRIDVDRLKKTFGKKLDKQELRSSHAYYKITREGRYIPIAETSESKIPIWVLDLETGTPTKSPEYQRYVTTGEMPPLWTEKDKAEMLLRGTTIEEAEQQRRNASLKGIADVLQLLNVPYAAVSGLMKGVQENIKWLTETEKEQPPGVLRRMAESVTGERPVGIGDVYADAIREITGKELTPGQRKLATIAGLASELVLPIMPARGGLPTIPQMGKQVEKALVKTASAAGREGLATIEQAFGKPLKLTIGEQLAAIGTHPERLTAAREIAKGLASAVGESPAKAEEMLLRIVGVHGEKLGKSGWYWPHVTGEIIPVGKTPAKTVKKFLESPRSEFAGKVSESSMLYKYISGTIQYGADMPPGAIDEIRKVHAMTSSMIESARKVRETIRKVIPGKTLPTSKLSPGEKAALLYDYDFVRYQQYENEITKITSEVADLEDMLRSPDITDVEKTKIQEKIDSLHELADAKRAGFEKITKDMKRLGLTDKELELGVLALPKEHREALELYKGLRKRNYDEMVAAGVDISELPDAISRIAKRQPLLQRIFGTTPIEYKISAPKVEGIPHQPKTHILPVEAGVSLAGSGSETVRYTFLRDLADISLAETYYTAHMTAAANLENRLLSAYGKRIKDLHELHSMELTGATRGMKLYEPKVGMLKGKNPDMPNGREVYLIDSSLADHLERITNKNTPNKLLEYMQKFENFWKIQSTLTAPRYVVRNMFFGNVAQMYIADVSLGSFVDAVNIMRQLAKRKPTGIDTPRLAWLDDMFKAHEKAGLKQIAGKTVEEWERLAAENKIFGTGFFGGEMATIMKGGISKIEDIARGLNILGAESYLTRALKKVNSYFEDVSKLAIFVDRIKKGYTVSDAASDAAKYLFNYDELSRPMQALKTAMPFLTWTYKNYGLQLWALANRPQKVANYFRLARGIEEIDPPTPEEKYLEMFMGEDREYQGRLRMPEARGEKGWRVYLPTASLLPQQELIKLNQRYFLRSMVEMLHPIFRLGAKAVIEEEKKLKYTPFGQPGDYREQGYVAAPDFLDKIMFKIRSVSPKAYNILSSVLVPQYDSLAYNRAYLRKYQQTGDELVAEEYARKTTPVRRHLWNREIESYLTAFDPGLARLMSLFRGGTEIETYDRLKGWLFGVKAGEYTPEMAEYDLMNHLIDMANAISREEKKAKQAGVSPKISIIDFTRR